MNSIQKRVCTGALLVFGVLFTSPAAQAQQQRVTFVHGIRSDGATWNLMKPTLDFELWIASQNPTLGSHLEFATQATNLHASLPPLGDAISISHSNGGIVSRVYATTNPAPRINRHISINTAHLGAPLAANVLNNSVTTWAVWLGRSIADPFDYYYQADGSFHQLHWLWAPTAQYLLGTLGFIDSKLGWLGFVSGPFLGDWLGYPPPVLAQMPPSAIQAMGLNSTASLATEAQKITQRISISNQLDVNTQPYSALWPSGAGFMQSTADLLRAFAIDRGNYYINHPNYQLRAGAVYWFALADDLNYVPRNWSVMNGSWVQDYPNGNWDAYANDGIVPSTQSGYPGGTRADMIGSQFGSIGHVEETSSPAVIARVRGILVGTMGVSPKPPAFSVIILGESVVEQGATCNYSPSVTNGTPPFTYQWYVNSSLMGTSQLFSYTFNAPATSIDLVVTDALNATASANKLVHTDPFGQGCF